jgi:NADH-quinone oxidoreductase subunit L
MVAIFIFIAAIGKSGQFPLFPWLMRAMEGPTTVSALIHGATMVNSGIYIVARLFDFYVASEALIVVAGIASLSAFIGATSALVQNEMKKVLAYSTMSHLSLAFIGLGAGSLAAGVGHLVNHAIFKALLFLSVGAVIMLSHHNKDIWRLGGLKNKLFFISLFMGMGVLSLSGIAPFSGYYSKDAIIATTLLNPQTFGLISTLTLLAGVLSIAYAGRLWVLMFLGKPRDKELFSNIKAPSKFWTLLPLGIMAFLTLGLGFYYEDVVTFFTGSSSHQEEVSYLAPLMVGGISALASLVYFFYALGDAIRDKVTAQPLMKTIHKILFNGYYVEMIVQYFAKNIVLQQVGGFVSFTEKKIIDRSINGIVNLMQKIFTIGMKTHTKEVSSQVGGMILGIVLMMIFLIVRSFV